MSAFGDLEEPVILMGRAHSSQMPATHPQNSCLFNPTDLRRIRSQQYLPSLHCTLPFGSRVVFHSRSNFSCYKLNRRRKTADM